MMPRVCSPIVCELVRRLQYFCIWLPYEKRFRFERVDRGKLFRSAQPMPKSLTYFVDKYGIRSLVILLKNCQNWELDFARSKGLNILHMPISNRAPYDGEMEEFFSFISDISNQPALMHCAQGRDRTGCFCFVYRVERMGWSILDAWQEMKKLGHGGLPWHQLTQGFLKEWLEKKYGVQLK